MTANVRLSPNVVLVPLVAALAGPSGTMAQTAQLTPSTMPRVGSVDERYQSYNVEMLEVTGGKFWRPYDGRGDSRRDETRSGDTPAGMDPAAFVYRPPIDLANARRRTLAAALGPAYVRVSGTWANTTYFADS